MVCSACGTELSEAEKVCTCGKPVELAFAAAASTASATAVASPPTVAPTTKACPYCGEQILFEAIRCKHCQASLVPQTAATPQTLGGVTVQGPQLPSNQPTIVIQNVQTQQGPPAWTYKEIKNPAVAVLLSLIFPGGGQFYNGHAGKGILVLLTFWIFGITYIWSLFDAYNSAKRINRTGA